MVTRHPNPAALYPVTAMLTQRQVVAVVRGLCLSPTANRDARRFLAELVSAAVPPPPDPP